MTSGQGEAPLEGPPPSGGSLHVLPRKPACGHVDRRPETLTPQRAVPLVAQPQACPDQAAGRKEAGCWPGMALAGRQHGPCPLEGPETGSSPQTRLGIPASLQLTLRCGHRPPNQVREAPAQAVSSPSQGHVTWDARWHGCCSYLLGVPSMRTKGKASGSARQVAWPRRGNNWVP